MRTDKTSLANDGSAENKNGKERFQFVKEPLPSGTALAWHARGAGFESPRNQNCVLVPFVLSLPLACLNCYLMSVNSC